MIGGTTILKSRAVARRLPMTPQAARLCSSFTVIPTPKISSAKLNSSTITPSGVRPRIIAAESSDGLASIITAPRNPSTIASVRA